MLSVLIVNWNTRDYLRACLFSLRRACAGLEHEIIVVDNASSDSSATMVQSEFPEVVLIANDRNYGYATGNNQAYERARGEFVWLLNPDTEILDDAPQQLIAFMEQHAGCGAVASALIDARSHRPQRSCRTFPTPGALWAEALGLARRFPRSRRFGFYRMGWWSYGDTRPVEQPQASSLLLRRAAIERCGELFDPQFPIFFNDVDLCWRLRTAGWTVWYLATARVRHWGGASTSQAGPSMIRESHHSLLRFYRKHYRAVLPPAVYGATVALVWLSGLWRERRATQQRASG